jgi:hypothetical protein
MNPTLQRRDVIKRGQLANAAVLVSRGVSA